MASIDQIATALISAHRTGTRITAPQRSLSRAEILAIQTKVAATLGAVAGFKVGNVLDGLPILAPLPAIYTVANGAARAVRDMLGIELEIGFKVIQALPPGDLPPRLQDYLRPYAVLELVDSRLDTQALSEDWKFCDFQMNAGLVVGTGPQAWDGTDFSTVRVKLADGTHICLDDTVSVPGGSALANLERLNRHLGVHCGGIQPGQTLITGSLTGLSYFTPGRTIIGEIAGLGHVTVTLAHENLHP
ncbi:hydratase [Roseinatronobacter sp.]|uniref:hydratase n=1 Tax=Roseinatronobacter sp. TaxID=1945755 RepID=UPI0025F72529|nr:hydratase [Rhodobaca sp.]